jgi:hypothetical protein
MVNPTHITTWGWCCAAVATAARNVTLVYPNQYISKTLYWDMLYIHQWTKHWDGTVTLRRCTISSMCLLTHPCLDQFDKCGPLRMVAFLGHQMSHGVSLNLEYCMSCGFSGWTENRFWSSNVLFLWYSTVFWRENYCHQLNAIVWNRMNWYLSLLALLRLYSRRTL